MEPPASAASATPMSSSASAPRARRPSLVSELGDLLANLPGLFSDRVELLSLELQRARLALMQCVLWSLAATVFGLTAWLTAWGAIAAAAVQAGLPWPWTALGVTLLNLLGAWIAIGLVRSKTPLLSLPATRRHLDFRPDSADAPPHVASETRQGAPR